MRHDRFFVGVDTHMIGAPFPIMVSDLRLRRRAGHKRAAAEVMIDSGSFTIHDTGQQFDPPAQYADRARHYMLAIGNVVSVSTYGRMCEPSILAKTGSDVDRNQKLTTQSFLELDAVAPEVPWLPELQGWVQDDYHRHIDHYESMGVDLTRFSAVGVGTICRREGTKEAQSIISSVAARGIKVHGFGVKTSGLQVNHRNITSADSFAWSYGARKRTTDCPHGIVKWERNCPVFLADWRDKVLEGLL